MSKMINYGNETRKKLMAGVEQIAKAVKVTLGPGGRLVMIGKKDGYPISTKDGVSVAKEVDLEDPFENLGASYVKEVSSKSDKDVADGTTTTSVLAYAIAKEGFKAIEAGYNPVAVKSAIENATNDIVEEIKKVAKPVSSNEDIINIATISANNDKETGKIIAEAFEKVGKDGSITIEESKNTTTSVEVEKGLEFDGGYSTAYFINKQDRMEAVLENPYILITDAKISAFKEILPIINKIASEKEKRPLVIVSEELDSEALTTLLTNCVRGTFFSLGVKAEGVGDNKKRILEDIAIATGGRFISKEKGDSLETLKLEDLGKADLVKANKEKTVIVGGKGSKEKIDERIAGIKASLEQDLNGYEKRNLKKRLAKLSGGVAVVKVGGFTEAEIIEKKYRVEDTLAAVRAALEEGIVAGGGLTLLKCANKINCKNTSTEEAMGYQIVKNACKEPMWQIAENAGVSGDVVINKINDSEHEDIGFDALRKEYCNLLKAGIIDPAKVTRTAIQNAASIASVLLVTDCAIVDKKETK